MTTNSFKHADQPQSARAIEGGADLYEQLNMMEYKPNTANSVALCSFQIDESEPKGAEKNKAGHEDTNKKHGTEKTEKTNDKLEAPEGSARKKRFEFEQAIKKADEQMPAKDFEKAIGELHYLSLLAKSEDSRFEPKKGLSQNDTELIVKKQTELATARNELTGKIVAPIEARMRYAQFLADSGGFSEAEKVVLEAKELAERFTKPAKITEHVQVSPLEIERQGLSTMYTLAFGMARPKGGLFPLGDSLMTTNVFLAKLYLGADVDWSKGVPKEIGDARYFDPVKAFDAVEKARQAAKDTRGFDPLSDRPVDGPQEIKNMYNALDKVFKDPAAFKLSERKNSDGQKFDPERIKEIGEKFGKLKQDPLNTALDLDSNARLKSLIRESALMGLGAGGFARPNPYKKPAEPPKQPEKQK